MHDLCNLGTKTIVYRSSRAMPPMRSQFTKENTIISQGYKCPTDVVVTLTARGVVHNGGIAGSVTTAEIGASTVNAPAMFLVSWGGGQTTHYVILNVTLNAFVQVTACNKLSVSLLTEDTVLQVNGDTYAYDAVGNTLIYANLVEANICESPISGCTEQIVSLDFLVQPTPAPRTLLTIPPSAYEMQYVYYANDGFQLNLNTYAPAPDPPLFSPPLWVRSLQPGNVLPGYPIIPSSQTTPPFRYLVDRTSVAIAAHIANVASRGNVTYVIRNP